MTYSEALHQETQEESASAAKISIITDRMGRNDAADQLLRRAFNVLGPLVRDLPMTDDLLLADESVTAWRTLRDRNPQLYLTYRSAVRQKCGRHVTDLLDSHIGPPALSPGRDLQLMTVDELLAQPAPTWLVDQRLPERGLVVMYGESQSGKTFLALDAALSVTRGVPWFGRQVRQGGVIYVAAEGRLRDRIDGYRAHHGIQSADLSRLRIIEGAVDLSGNTRDLDQLTEQITAAAAEIGGVSLIVLDTLARVMAGTDENSGKDMGAFIAAAKRIEEACAGLVLTIHHSGKNVTAGARGHSSLRAATDAEIEVTRDEAGVRTARVTKLRDGQDGETFSFRLDSVRVGINGNQRSCCVVVQTDEQAKPRERERRLSADEAIALSTLQEEISSTGFVLPQTSAIPGGKRGVLIANWKDRLLNRLGEDRDISRDSKVKAFSRGMKGLSARKIIGISNLYVWIW